MPHPMAKPMLVKSRANLSLIAASLASLDAVGLLVARAFRDVRVTAVAAETLPSPTASQTVLSRNGFVLVSRRADDELGEVLRYALRRAV